MARGRPIKGNKHSRVPRAHVAIGVVAEECQTETAGTLQRFAVGAANYWRHDKGRITAEDDYTTEATSDLWAWAATALKQGTTTWIWVHDAIKTLTLLDWWQLWDSGRFKAEWYVLDNEVVIIAGRLDRCAVRIVDVRNWLPFPGRQLAEWVGTETPLADSDGRLTVHPVVAAAAAAATIAAVAKRLSALVRGNDLGSMRYTASSQAFRHWRHLGTAAPVVPSANPRECELARDSYFSGRTELFRVGPVKGPIYVLDCNGMYSAAMLASEQPRKLVDFTDAGSIDQLARVMPLRAVIADVLLETSIPFPHRLQDVGTVYPVGTYWTTLAGPELHSAFSHGMVRDVRRMASYVTGRVCHEFVQRWWDWRKQWQADGDRVLGALAKAMPNYLYGRWGQTSRAWEPVGNDSESARFGTFTYIDPQTRQAHPGRTIAGESQADLAHVYRTRRDHDKMTTCLQRNWRYDLETPYSFPAIASWITSQARVMMNNFRLTAGEHNVFYQCHDCLHVNGAGAQRLFDAGCTDSDQLGKLKMKAVHESAEYYGVNLLRLDGKLCAAGLPELHRENADGSISALSYEGLAALLKRGPDGTVRMKAHDWTLRAQYAHGVPLSSGAVSPLSLGAPLSGGGGGGAG